MRVVLFWSSGKDAAWALHVLRQHGVEVVALLTTVDAATDRVGLHGVSRAVVQAQADASGVPLHPVALPWPASNRVYEAHVRSALEELRKAGATHAAFGDLFLEDVRAYREQLLAGTGLTPLFPLWRPAGGTAALSRSMLAGGLGATVCCADTTRLPLEAVGRPYDEGFLSALPKTVDPCGERGGFHTVCTAGPMFSRALQVEVGGIEAWGDFALATVTLATPPR